MLSSRLLKNIGAFALLATSIAASVPSHVKALDDCTVERVANTGTRVYVRCKESPTEFSVYADSGQADRFMSLALAALLSRHKMSLYTYGTAPHSACSGSCAEVQIPVIQWQ